MLIEIDEVLARGVRALAMKACADVPCFCERVSEDEWDRRLCATHGRDSVVDAVAAALREAIVSTVAKYEGELAGKHAEWCSRECACEAAIREATRFNRDK